MSKALGGHVHLRVFAAPEGGDFASLGTMVARCEEWEVLEAMLRAGAKAFPDDVELTVEARDG